MFLLSFFRSMQVAIRAELGKLDAKVTKLTLLGFSCAILRDQNLPLPHQGYDLTMVGHRKLLECSPHHSPHCMACRAVLQMLQAKTQGRRGVFAFD